MVTSFRMRLSDGRGRQLEALQEATGESTNTKAVMKAVRYYLRMRGDNPANPQGTAKQLLTEAHTEGSLTAAEIADLLDSPELHVAYESEIDVSV